MMEFKPLAAKVTANRDGAKTTLASDKVVYALATAAATVTNATSGATFQMGANQAVIFHKDKFD